jgi:hypothetical protein
MRVVDPPPPSFTSQFLILGLCAMIPWLVCLLIFSLDLWIHPPPLLYSSVSNPWPLRDDSLVGLSVNFSFGFTDSLLELGDLFVVFFVSLLGLLENLHWFIRWFGVATLSKATGALYLY